MDRKSFVFRIMSFVLAGMFLVQACNSNDSTAAEGKGSDSFFINPSDTAMPPESTSFKSPAIDTVAVKPDHAAKDSPGVKPKVRNGKIKLTDTARK